MTQTFKLCDLLRPELVIDLPTCSKDDALKRLTEAAGRDARVLDTAAFFDAVMHRESQASTGIGMGLAIPHAKIPQILDHLLVVGRSREGLQFDALDGQPVHLVFLIGASDRQTRDFVRLLAAVTHVLKHDDLRRDLIAADSTEAMINLLRTHETAI